MSWIADFNLNEKSGINSVMEEVDFEKYDHYEIFVEGFLLPRFQYYDKYKNLPKNALVAKLYEEMGMEFVKYIKGSYNIIIKAQNYVYFVNDFHSMSKFFYFKNENRLIISSDLNQIKKKVKLLPDYENIALFFLMEHNVGGFTIFKNVYCSQPSSIFKIHLKTYEVEIDSYFDINDFISAPKNKVDLRDFSDFWKDNINNYISYLNPQKIGLTITGGNDSRMILAALVKKNQPVLFTFGNPKSFDAIVSQKVADRLNLKHNNYYVSSPTKEWFKNYSKKIIKNGNTFINIHRAHRLNAIEEEVENNPNMEMLFTGFMGGEYTKGVIYDNYITPQFLWEYEFGKQRRNIRSIISNILKKKFFNPDSINLDVVEERINTLPFINGATYKIREINTLFSLVGSVHSWQDIFIFGSRVQYVVNPFMDIDFLEMLYSSDHSFLQKSSKFLHDFLRLGRSDFHVSITHDLCPELSDIEYAKKGHYTAHEYKNDFPILLLFKRMLRLKKDRSHPPSFPYGEWAIEFLIEELSEFKDLNFFIDINGLRKCIANLKKETYNEGELHIFTNALNVNFNIINYA